MYNRVKVNEIKYRLYRVIKPLIANKIIFPILQREIEDILLCAGKNVKRVNFFIKCSSHARFFIFLHDYVKIDTLSRG